MSARYFIGLTLPTDLSAIISDVQNKSISSHLLMKPIQPHITLLDPNTLMDVSPMYLIPKVKELATQYLPLNITLSEIESFENRVLYIAADSPELIKFQAALSALLPDKVQASHLVGRSFTPHVTLAQAKPRQKLVGNLEQSFQHKLAGFLPATFTANHISKFTWQAPRTYNVSDILLTI